MLQGEKTVSCRYFWAVSKLQRVAKANDIRENPLSMDELFKNSRGDGGDRNASDVFGFGGVIRFRNRG